MRLPSTVSSAVLGTVSGGLARVWAEFWRGFSEPSRTAFFTMLVSFAAMLALTLWFFSPGTLAGPVGRYLARSPLDSEGAVTHRALRLGVTPASAPRLLVLGASGMAQALASEPALADALRDATGEAWEAHILTTPLQSPFDQLAILETALGPPPGPDQPPGPPVVVAIGVNLLRPGWSAERMIGFERQGRLGLRSAWADAEMRRLGAEPRPRTGFYARDNLNFVAVNASRSLLRLLVRMPAKPRIAHYAPIVRMPAAQRPRATLADRAGAAGGADAPLWGIYARLAEELRAWPQVRLVFLEEPLDPDFIADMGLGVQKAAFEARMAAFAAANGAVWWPLLGAAEVDPTAFTDDLHIADPAAQARLRDLLARRIAQDRAP